MDSLFSSLVNEELACRPANDPIPQPEAECLCGLPRHRRQALLWRYRHVDPARLDAIIRASNRRPCHLPTEDRLSDLHAALDESGGWRLQHDAILL